MILTCPACATRYRVDDQEFEGSPGRTVRCANCGHLWYEAGPSRRASALSPVEKPPARRFEAATERPAAEALAVAPVAITPRRSAPAPRARSPAARLVTVAALVAAVVIGGVVLYRHSATEQQAAWRPPARLDQQISASAPMPATGLVIRNITPAHTAAGLVVGGEIVNSGSAARNLPRLRVVLQDAAEKEVQFKTVDPPKARLQPGEVVHFETPFADPPNAAAGVVVTFAPS